ncbi:hypothetical protein D0X99_10650 [Algoriphagus lacus]|uniref:Uncharacterized protein n=1 Tax=Algoriphagus lacus TaxID=2056311 RepID=A0A418PSL1_9BACT|nr:hypothetical protein [Algoriphagus lacus]RIW15871.1 hypothetical protein D0X99_10650 [Algoriphagus lacus]
MTQPTSQDPITAAFLTFLIPGWGQIRQGKVKTGILWMIGVIAAYLLIVPGLILHAVCIVDAYVRD